jgi:hypothetical protein
VRKELKLSYYGGDSVSNKCKRGYGGAYGGFWRNLRLMGVWSQAFGFERRCEDVFTFNLLSKTFYKCYAFSAICKDNSAINCISV